MAKRILCLDLGDKRIGLAVSDPSRTIASGRGVHRRGDLEEDLDYLRRLVEQEGIAEVVIGLPQNMDGSLGSQAQKALQLKELLERRVKIPVKLFDERLTSEEAERVLISANLGRRKRKEVIDELAAVIILQSYLNYLIKEEEEDA